MAYPCKGCILLITCHEDCERIIEYDDKLTIRKFIHKKRCLDCGHQFFIVYTPKNNTNINTSNYSNTEYYDHFYIRCLNCRTVYLIEISYWHGELRKEKYVMERVGKCGHDENEFIISTNIFSSTTLGEDHKPAFEMRANKIVKTIKYGLEK